MSVHLYNRRPNFRVDWQRTGLRSILRERGAQYLIHGLLQRFWSGDRHQTLKLQLVPPKADKITKIVVKSSSSAVEQEVLQAMTLYSSKEAAQDVEARQATWPVYRLLLWFATKATLLTANVHKHFTPYGASDGTMRLKTGCELYFDLTLDAVEYEALRHAPSRVIPPDTSEFFRNGRYVPPRHRVGQLQATLPTVAPHSTTVEHAQALVELYEPLAQEPARLYEWGVPVAETGGKFDMVVAQKIPLGPSEATCDLSYLQTLHALALITQTKRLSATEAFDAWVRSALEHPLCTPEAVRRVAYLRYGTEELQVVRTHKPKQGQVARGTLSSREWAALGRYALLKKEDEAQSATPIQEAPPTQLIPPLPASNVTAKMKRFAAFIDKIAQATLRESWSVTFTSENLSHVLVQEASTDRGTCWELFVSWPQVRTTIEDPKNLREFLVDALTSRCCRGRPTTLHRDAAWHWVTELAFSKDLSAEEANWLRKGFRP